jgi:hypothetical protein
MTCAAMTDHPSRTRYPLAVLADCAQREVKIRRQVYPGYVMRHRMTQAKADAEISKMAAIAEMLVEMAERERLL